MKLYNLNFATLILRFYLLMVIVIGSFFIGYPILSILSLPVFFSAMLGMTFTKSSRTSRRTAVDRFPAQNRQHQTAH